MLSFQLFRKTYYSQQYINIIILCTFNHEFIKKKTFAGMTHQRLWVHKPLCKPNPWYAQIWLFYLWILTVFKFLYHLSLGSEGVKNCRVHAIRCVHRSSRVRYTEGHAQSCGWCWTHHQTTHSESCSTSSGLVLSYLVLKMTSHNVFA